MFLWALLIAVLFVILIPPQNFTFPLGMKRIHYQRVKFISLELLDATFFAYWGRGAGDFFS